MHFSDFSNKYNNKIKNHDKYLKYVPNTTVRAMCNGPFETSNSPEFIGMFVHNKGPTSASLALPCSGKVIGDVWVRRRRPKTNSFWHRMTIKLVYERFVYFIFFQFL